MRTNISLVASLVLGTFLYTGCSVGAAKVDGSGSSSSSVSSAVSSSSVSSTSSSSVSSAVSSSSSSSVSYTGTYTDAIIKNVEYTLNDDTERFKTNLEGKFNYGPNDRIKFWLGNLNLRNVNNNVTASDSLVILESNPIIASLLQSFDDDGILSNGIDVSNDLIDSVKNFGIVGTRINPITFEIEYLNASGNVVTFEQLQAEVRPSAIKISFEQALSHVSDTLKTISPDSVGYDLLLKDYFNSLNDDFSNSYSTIIYYDVTEILGILKNTTNEKIKLVLAGIKNSTLYSKLNSTAKTIVEEIHYDVINSGFTTSLLGLDVNSQKMLYFTERDTILNISKIQLNNDNTFRKNIFYPSAQPEDLNTFSIVNGKIELNTNERNIFELSGLGFDYFVVTYKGLNISTSFEEQNKKVFFSEESALENYNDVFTSLFKNKLIENINSSFYFTDDKVYFFYDTKSKYTMYTLEKVYNNKLKALSAVDGTFIYISFLDTYVAVEFYEDNTLKSLIYSGSIDPLKDYLASELTALIDAVDNPVSSSSSSVASSVASSEASSSEASSVASSEASSSEASSVASSEASSSEASSSEASSSEASSSEASSSEASSVASSSSSSL